MRMINVEVPVFEYPAIGVYPYPWPEYCCFNAFTARPQIFGPYGPYAYGPY